MRYITKIKLASTIFLAVIALSLIISQNASPDNPAFWSLKRAQEKVYLRLKSNPQEKLDYMSFLLDRRLDELSSQVKRQSYSQILPSASRYSSLAGQITELIISNNFTAYIEPTKQKFHSHQKVLQDLYILYPKNTDNIEYKYIEDDINYLNIYLDKLR